MDDWNEHKSKRIEVWSNILTHVLAWNEERILNWISRWKEELDDPHNLFWHHGDVEFVTPLLIPKSLRQKISPTEVINIENNFGHIILDFLRTSDVNWESLSKQLENILSTFGEKLPRSCD